VTTLPKARHRRRCARLWSRLVGGTGPRSPPESALYGPALQLAIRNPLTHDLTEITAQQGAERLSALSLLAQLLEACDLVHATKEAGQVDMPSN
jgi:hypothetical protein